MPTWLKAMLYAGNTKDKFLTPAFKHLARGNKRKAKEPKTTTVELDGRVYTRPAKPGSRPTLMTAKKITRKEAAAPQAATQEASDKMLFTQMNCGEGKTEAQVYDHARVQIERDFGRHILRLLALDQGIAALSKANPNSLWLEVRDMRTKRNELADSSHSYRMADEFVTRIYIANSSQSLESFSPAQLERVRSELRDAGKARREVERAARMAARENEPDKQS